VKGFFEIGSFFYYKFFIRIFSLYGGGIQSDNSDQTYIVHYLHFTYHLSRLGLVNYLPRLTLNCDPPDLCL
jgi:hypothetical protein